ncbi:MAG: VWA domain-containing protein [Candidatus Sulfopaludibacter sp.]|nr:VWA domain-containing protein [Candidatus Sulfopaludibacter sp.]
MLWLAIAAFLAAPQGPVIRVPVHLVSVPALVFAGDGKCVAGLEASDFQVLDEGRPQHFTLDTDYLPPSVAVVVQVSAQVRQYLPFISKAGSAVEDLLVGENGEAAIITYDDFVTVRKDFEAGETRAAFRKISVGGKRSRMIDAAMAGVDLLKQQPASRSRVLLLIGQPSDRGSQADLEALREEAERENVTIFALALPQFNKAFIEDTFSLQGPGFKEERGGYKAGVDLSKLVPTLAHESEGQVGADPFAMLTHATGGTLLHFRTQRALEDAVGIVGTELRSVYTLSFPPDSTQPGYHNLKVEVNVPGAVPYARPGYRLPQ